MAAESFAEWLSRAYRQPQDTYTVHNMEVAYEAGRAAAAQASHPQAQVARSADQLWGLVEAYAAARVGALDKPNTLPAVEAAHGRMLRLEVALRQSFAAQGGAA